MKIAFWGNFGVRNFGNECTLAAILYNIRRRLPASDFVSVSVEPEDTAERHHISAIPMWPRRPGDRAFGPVKAIRRAIRPIAEWRRVLRETRGLSALIVPGTGVLNDIGRSPFGFPYNLFKWVLAARLGGGRVFFVSVGVEKIEHPLSRLFITSSLRLAGYRSFRDTRSLTRIRAAGFRATSGIYPDLAFSLPQHTPGENTRRLSGRIVGVGVCNYRELCRHSDATISYETYVDHVGSTIRWLIERGYDVRLIIGDVRDVGVRADVRDWLQSHGLPPAHGSYCDHLATSFEQVIEQLEAVDFVIASRFHNIVLALLRSRPVIALSYEGKIEALMQDMDLGDYCQVLAHFDRGRLLEQFQQMELNAPLLRSAIEQRVQANRGKLDRQYDLLVARLGATPLTEPDGGSGLRPTH